MARMAVIDPNDLPTRIVLFLCDTDGCNHRGVWLCPQGVIACDKHKPKNGAKK